MSLKFLDSRYIYFTKENFKNCRYKMHLRLHPSFFDSFQLQIKKIRKYFYKKVDCKKDECRGAKDELKSHI